MIGGGLPATPFPQFTPYPEDDRKLIVSFTADPSQAPRLDARTGEIEIGKDWMRLNLPDVWASWCALRLLGREPEVTVVEYNRITTKVLFEAGPMAKNLDLAKQLLEEMSDVMRRDCVLRLGT